MPSLAPHTLLPHLKGFVYVFYISAVVICGLLCLGPSVRIISVVSVIPQRVSLTGSPEPPRCSVAPLTAQRRLSRPSAIGPPPIA